MRLVTQLCVVFPLTILAASLVPDIADAVLLARFYKSKLVAIRDDVLNGVYFEGAPLFKRQDCSGTQCPDGCFNGANDICCPAGGGACDAGEACCGSDGCVPLDGSVCCASGGYCKPGRLCATYQSQDVCCLDSGCTELDQSDGSTYTITDGTATLMGTGAVTTVSAGAGVSSASSSTVPFNASASAGSSSIEPTTTTEVPTSSQTSDLYTIETINPSSEPSQPALSPTQTSSAQPTGPSIVIVTTPLEPTVVTSPIPQTFGTLTTTEAQSPTSTTGSPSATGAACRADMQAWAAVVAILYFL